MNEFENNYVPTPEDNSNNSNLTENTPVSPVSEPAPAPVTENIPAENAAPAHEADAITEDLTSPASNAGNIPPYTPPYNNSFSEGPNGSFPPPPRTPAEFNHSGEYRYVPPFSNVGANTGRPMTPPPYGPAPQQPPRMAKKEKKEKAKTVRTFPTAALVLILVGSILLSFASGIAGALLVSGGFEMNEETVEESGDRGELVVNKQDESSESESAVLEGEYDLTDVCAVVSASVVEITTEFNQTYYGYYQYVQEGAGSGVIISEDGYLLTNAHVITDSQSGNTADAIKVRLTNGEEYDATIIGNDSDSDIALLKIEGEGFAAATVGNSDTIEVGEQVLAVGNPLGELGGTVTSGIVSATNREISVENNKMTLIQIDAAINPGNSGGGLFNTKGELIGIVNAKTTDVTVEGLGFAIPVNEAVSVAEELEEHGYVTGRTHIGISLTDVTDAFTAYYYFRTEVTGVYVVNVQEGYNENVLQYGDRITAINGNEISSSEDVKELVKDSEVGDVLTFTISREGKIMEVEVTCYEYVPENDVSFDQN